MYKRQTIDNVEFFKILIGSSRHRERLHFYRDQRSRGSRGPYKPKILLYLLMNMGSPLYKVDLGQMCINLPEDTFKSLCLMTYPEETPYHVPTHQVLILMKEYMSKTREKYDITSLIIRNSDTLITTGDDVMFFLKNFLEEDEDLQMLLLFKSFEFDVLELALPYIDKDVISKTFIEDSFLDRYIDVIQKYLIR